MPYKDKNKARESQRKHYRKNKDYYKEKRRLKQLENKKFILYYLSDKSCVDCGLTDIRVLEFDHITNDKVSNISTLVKNGNSIESILKELTKCEVRCCNCHRVATIERNPLRTNR